MCVPAPLQPFAHHSDPPVAGFLHTPDSPNGIGLALTHGAGANCRSRLLTLIAEAFCDAGVSVLRFDLPFRQQRPTGPPMRGSAERDQEGIRNAIACVRSLAQQVFVGGHSYGGRQASMLAADDPGTSRGLLLLSYPLHPPKRPTELRTAHFARLRRPALFVSGARDGFGTTQELTAAIGQIPARTQLLSISGAGHELLTRSNEGQLPKMIVESFLRFVEGPVL